MPLRMMPRRRCLVAMTMVMQTISSAMTGRHCSTVRSVANWMAQAVRAQGEIGHLESEQDSRAVVVTTAATRCTQATGKRFQKFKPRMRLLDRALAGHAV